MCLCVKSFIKFKETLDKSFDVTAKINKIQAEFDGLQKKVAGFSAAGVNKAFDSLEKLESPGKLIWDNSNFSQKIQAVRLGLEIRSAGKEVEKIIKDLDVQYQELTKNLFESDAIKENFNKLKDKTNE